MEIHKNYKDLVTTQEYKKKPTIEGVRLEVLPHFTTEDGSFLEIARFSEDSSLQLFPEFKTKQISQSIMLPGSIKAFHLHYKQTDVWFVHPQMQLLVGLVDVRADSPSAGVTMRLAMGGKAQMLLIPPGVAHGVANLTQTTQMLTYFTDQYFDMNEPDERRISYDVVGKEFWHQQPG